MFLNSYLLGVSMPLAVTNLAFDVLADSVNELYLVLEDETAKMFILLVLSPVLNGFVIGVLLEVTCLRYLPFSGETSSSESS